MRPSYGVSEDPEFPVKIFSFDKQEVTLLQLADLRRTIMDRVQSFAFDVMVVNKNVSFTKDQTFMDYFNAVLIYPPRVLPVSLKEDVHFSGSLAVFGYQGKGDKVAVTDEIFPIKANGFRIGENQSLFWLREYEELDVVLHIKQGVGREHTKFRPTNEVTLNPDTYTISIESAGIMSPEHIMERALDIMVSQ